MYNHISKSTSNNKILLIEDDEIIQWVHCHMLKQLGFQTEIVDSGQAAINRTATEDYAAILLDLGLPDVQGEEVIVAIRSREKTTNQHLPIIANSAHAAEETLQTIRKKGADIALMKPISKDHLKQCLLTLGLEIPNIEGV